MISGRKKDPKHRVWTLYHLVSEATHHHFLLDSTGTAQPSLLPLGYLQGGSSDFAGTLTWVKFQEFVFPVCGLISSTFPWISRQEEPGRRTVYRVTLDTLEVAEVWRYTQLSSPTLTSNACCYLLSSDLFPDTPWFVFWVTVHVAQPPGSMYLCCWKFLLVFHVPTSRT